MYLVGLVFPISKILTPVHAQIIISFQQQTTNFIGLNTLIVLRVARAPRGTTSVCMRKQRYEAPQVALWTALARPRPSYSTLILYYYTLAIVLKYPEMQLGGLCVFLTSTPIAIAD